MPSSFWSLASGLTMPLTRATTLANTRRSKCKCGPRREITARARSLNGADETDETESITFPNS